MPRAKKGSPEAKAWAEKMRQARKKTEAQEKVAEVASPIAVEPSEIIEKQTNPVITEILKIVREFFPEAQKRVIDRHNTFAVEIILSKDDTRSFVVDVGTALIETRNWCQKIKDKIEGKQASRVTTIETLSGVRTSMKKLPSNLGSDEEFFFRE